MRRRRVLTALGTAFATVGAGCTAVGSLGGVDGDVGMAAPSAAASKSLVKAQTAV